MFGYIRIYKPQLRICEYEAYKAVYCTICRQIGRDYGIGARMLLSYDFTFVAMLYMALNGQSMDYRKGRCVCDPLKRCGFCTCESDAFKLTGAMTAEMFYYKIADNIEDSGAFGKLFWKGMKLAAAPMRRKAMRNYPDIDPLVARCITEQAAAESMDEPSIDQCAEPSAKLISALAVMLSEDETERVILKDFGYYLGRWIYLIDAFDDIVKDIKSGSFNPFVRRFGLTREDANDDSPLLTEAREYANQCLNMTVARANTAFGLLNTGEFAPIFENILYWGLGEVQRRALHEKELQKQ